jgi:Fe-S oxidoreductase
MMLAEQNVETLNGYGMSGKRIIITACPHCFNTLGNEYSDFGGNYEVVHHSDFLNGLIAERQAHAHQEGGRQGRVPRQLLPGPLQRRLRAPRARCWRIPGVELVEVEYWNKSKGLCCGAGGAQMWMESSTASA